MAPEIALRFVRKLPKRSTILDPMTGSGTTLRQAVIGGHKAIGCDLDPLAVMMSLAATTSIDFNVLESLHTFIINKARQLELKKINLPWIDKETRNFINFWFARKQREGLRRIAYILHSSRKLKCHPHEHTVLKIAFSRLIITKHIGASLAWDVSHSRPHKVMDENDYDVWYNFSLSVRQVSKHLKKENITGRSRIYISDARALKIKSRSIDAVITSPPYLNAIDYMRGHKFSLVWLGYSISQLRQLRSHTVGSELGCCFLNLGIKFDDAICDMELLPPRYLKMIVRYAADAHKLMKEIERVLKPKGKVLLVVGDSCLKGAFIKNSEIFSQAGKLCGLNLKRKRERKLPLRSRYLPLPNNKSSALAKRMRTEVILEFAKG